MNDIIIGDLTPADKEAGWATCFAGYCTFYESPFSDDLADRVFELLMNPEVNLFCLVARSQSMGVVGIAHYRAAPSSLNGKNITFLDDLFTVPELRGTGIGKKLILEVHARAAAKDELPLQWITAETNVAARALYNKLADCTSWWPYSIRFDVSQETTLDRVNLPEGYSIISFKDLKIEDEGAWREIFAKYAMFYESPALPEILATVFGWLIDPMNPFQGLFVKNSSRKIVALAHFRPRVRSMSGGDVCYLDDLFVAPGDRGKGIADFLLQEMYAACLNNKWPRAHWLTASTNTKAQRVYERNWATRQKFILYEMK
jgi:GNAT superfamily N-acetyltransferase